MSDSNKKKRQFQEAMMDEEIFEEDVNFDEFVKNNLAFNK